MILDLAGFRDAELNLDTFVATAHRLLRRAQVHIDDGRVAGAVDARGIRYYQSLGVIDRPLRYQGRRAIYGYRHLLQLLAVRRLQRDGYPLAVIQATLPSKATAELEAEWSRLLAALRRPADAPAAWAAARPQSGPPRRVLTGDLAPGITLSIDPGRVTGVDALYERIATRVAQLLTEE